MDKLNTMSAAEYSSEKISNGKTFGTGATHPFWVIVNKEISDHVRSWRFIILLAIFVLTCIGSMYTAMSNFGKAIKANDPDEAFFFLKLFTITDGTLPSFTVFIGFLGPLLGISLGFDAINSEHNRGTLSRILSQPIYRDYILNAKFLASLIVISVLFFSLGFSVIGLGLVTIGIPPTAEEFLRIVFFLIMSIVYVAFWLNMAILFSVRYRQAATSALSGISIWLFFSVFFELIVNLIAKAVQPPVYASELHIIAYQRLILNVMRFSPAQLLSEATTTLLMPSVRSLGPLSMEQVSGAIPSPLSLGQSLLLVWPQATALIAGTIVFFAMAYWWFMRREIRSR